jgi:hypothetical protein
MKRKHIVSGLLILAVVFLCFDIARRIWSSTVVWIPSVEGMALLMGLHDSNRLAVMLVSLEDAKLMPLFKQTHRDWADHADQHPDLNFGTYGDGRLLYVNSARKTWIIGSSGDSNQPARVLLISFPLWLLGALAVVYPMWTFVRTRDRRRLGLVPAITKDHAIQSDTIEDDVKCVSCGYNLRGLSPQGRCPECGSGIAQSIKAECVPAVPSVCDRLLRAGLIAGALSAWLLAFCGNLFNPGGTHWGVGKRFCADMIDLSVSINVAVMLVGGIWLAISSYAKQTSAKWVALLIVLPICTFIFCPPINA